MKFTFSIVLSLVLAASSKALTSTPLMLGTLNDPDYLVSLDRTTAIGTRIGPLGIESADAMTALEYDSVHDVLYGATSATVPDLYTVSPSSGLATRVGATGALGILATGMAYDPISDTLYASGGDRFFRKNLYVLNRTTGGSTLLGSVAGISDSIQGLSFDPSTGRLYALDEFASSGARIMTIDIPTRVATPLTGNINPTQDGWNSLTFDPYTGDLFVGSNNTLYQINPNTGNITTIGLMYSPDLNTYGSLTVMSPYIVPEPISITSLTACFVTWLLSRRSMKRKSRVCPCLSRIPIK